MLRSSVHAFCFFSRARSAPSLSIQADSWVKRGSDFPCAMFKTQEEAAKGMPLRCSTVHSNTFVLYLLGVLCFLIDDLLDFFIDLLDFRIVSPFLWRCQFTAGTLQESERKLVRFVIIIIGLFYASSSSLLPPIRIMSDDSVLLSDIKRR